MSAALAVFATLIAIAPLPLSSISWPRAFKWSLTLVCWVLAAVIFAGILGV